MSARSSRLHALERSLKAPCKSRPKAHALTVMRFEGGSASVRPSQTHPARLPKDVEDQIAVVRGHAIGKPSRGLFQLEQRLLLPAAVGPTQPAIQRHTHGATPSIASPPAAASHAYALSAPVTATEFGGRYNVESFEDSSNAAIASPPITVAPTVSPCAEPATRVSEPPQRDRVTRRKALTAEQQAVAASFERDIASMLGATSPASSPENQQWDNAVRNAAKAPTDTPPAPAVVTPEPTATPKLQGHDVFNQMGLAMNYANSFDLGAMDLSARFDRFDDELALASKTPPPTVTSASMAIPAPTSVQALALDDFDLMADLTEISGAQSVPAPSASVSASEPCVTKEEAPPVAPAPVPPPQPSNDSPAMNERMQS